MKSWQVLKRILLFKLRNFIKGFASSFIAAKDLASDEGFVAHLATLFTHVNKGVAFFFLYNVCVMLFFFIGNYQMLTDDSLLVITRCGAIVSILLLFFSVVSFALGIICAITATRTKRRAYYIAHSLIIPLVIITALVTLFFFHSVNVLSSGIG